MRVPVQTKTAFSAGSPQLVLQGSYFPSGHYYGVMPDAKQFVFIKPADQSHAPTQINVVTNWFDELRGRISATTKP
jgi:hypothetical protein